MKNIGQITENSSYDALDNEYKIYSLPNAYKLGYVCEPKGIDLPIYIQTSEQNGYTEIKLSKRGMYEVQDEDLNEEFEIIDGLNLDIISIKIPSDIKFKLDYVY